jgi:ParB family chromosome partitioning protein
MRDIEDDDELDGPGPDPDRKHNIQHSHKSSEWYTPEWLMDAARDVLGPIDLDPASNAIANRFVQAAEWFDIRRDGLYGDAWCKPGGEPASIWLNPPSPAWLWWGRLMEQNRNGAVEHAIFVAFNVQLAQVSQGKGCPSILGFPVCWFSKRIKFVGNGNSPANASALVYVPGTVDNSGQFKLTFRKYGAITVPAKE